MRQTTVLVALLTLPMLSAAICGQTAERDQPGQAARASNGVVEMSAAPIADHDRLGVLEKRKPVYPWTGLIEVTIRNVSHRSVRLVESGGPWDNYTMDVLDGSGKPVSMTERGKKESEEARHFTQPMLISASVIDLQPYREFKEKIDLSDYFEVHRGDPYTVKITRSKGLPEEDDEGKRLKQVAVTCWLSAAASGVPR